MSRDRQTSAFFLFKKEGADQRRKCLPSQRNSIEFSSLGCYRESQQLIHVKTYVPGGVILRMGGVTSETRSLDTRLHMGWTYISTDAGEEKSSGLSHKASSQFLRARGVQ